MIHEYRLLRQIGSGGMGEIYKAHDTFLDRPVAVKFVHALHTAPDARQRFPVEARAAARTANSFQVPLALRRLLRNESTQSYRY